MFIFLVAVTPIFLLHAPSSSVATIDLPSAAIHIDAINDPQPTANTSSTVDHSKANVFGPGLHADHIILPARYFHIQATTADGHPYTHSLRTPYTIRISGHSRRYGHCRTHTQQFDRGDGSVLVRYKLVDECTQFAIHIEHSGHRVGRSPYTLANPDAVVRSDQCNCPRPIDMWLRENNCPTDHPQITSDLRPFQTASVNVTAIRAQLLQRFGTSATAGSVALCHYVVRSNRIHRQCYGQHVGFKMFADAVLVALVRQMRLPDAELLINLGDWPLIKRGGQTRTTGPLPVFSWCGSGDSYDIVWPTYDLTESSLQSMGRVMLDMQSVQEQRWPWADKKAAAFWRGRDSRRERLRLVEISREPEVAELFNVSLTNFFFFRDEEPKYGPRSAHISFMDFFEYKWQICVDGSVAAYRMPYLLGGDALVLKQESPFYEHFYGQLEAWRHYVPVRRDLADLVEKVRWARDNEDEARKIVARGQQFARENLQADHVLCYHALLLKVSWREVSICL